MAASSADDDSCVVELKYGIPPEVTVPETVTGYEGTGVVHEGDPALVSCRKAVLEVLPGRIVHDVQPLENVAQYTRSPASEADGKRLISAFAAEDAAVRPCAIHNVPLFISEAAMLLLVKVCGPAKFASVSVAAGILTVTVPKAPVTGSRVSSPLVALPSASEPSVPDAPSVGVAVQADAELLVVFGTCPAAADDAAVPPCAIASVPLFISDAAIETPVSTPAAVREALVPRFRAVPLPVKVNWPTVRDPKM